MKIIKKIIASIRHFFKQYVFPPIYWALFAGISVGLITGFFSVSVYWGALWGALSFLLEILMMNILHIFLIKRKQLK